MRVRLKPPLPLGIVEAGISVFQKLEVTQSRSTVNAGSSVGVFHGDQDELGMTGSFVENGSRVAMANAFAISMDIDNDGILQGRGVIVII